MFPPLDIFRVDGTEPLWLAAAESLVQALEVARNNGLGAYMVFSHKTGHQTMYSVDATGAVHPVNQTAPSTGDDSAV